MHLSTWAYQKQFSWERQRRKAKVPGCRVPAGGPWMSQGTLCSPDSSTRPPHPHPAPVEAQSCHHKQESLGKLFSTITLHHLPPNGFPWGSAGKESAHNVGDLGLIPGLGRSPGGGHGNPLQYFCLENPHGQKSLVGFSLWGCKELDMNEGFSLSHRKLGK